VTGWLGLALTAVLSMTVNAASPPPPGSLPEIELPEYIISGVERATNLGGVRLPSEAKATVETPEPQPAGRPALLMGAAWTPPLRPNLTTEPGKGRWNAGLSAGSFRHVGVNAGAAADVAQAPFGVDIAYDRPPRRIKAGQVQEATVAGAAALNLGKSVWLSPDLGFGWDEYQLAAGSVKDWRRQGNFRFGASITPINTEFGGLTGGVYVDRWALTDEVQGAYLKGEVSHFTSMKGGWLETILGYTAEPTSGTGSDLRLLKLGTQYRYRLAANLLGWGGVKLYSGASAEGDRAHGVMVNAGVEYRTPKDAVISLQFCPDAEILPLRNWTREFPTLPTNYRGYLVSDQYRIRLRVRMAEDTPWSTGFTLETFNRDWSIPHGSRQVNIVVIRTGWKLPGLGDESAVQVWAMGVSDENGITAFGYPTLWCSSFVGSADETPYLPPWSLGLMGRFDIGATTINSDITWQEGTPDSFIEDYEPPSRLVWNASLKRDLGGSWEAGLELDNILNRRYYDIPRYDKPPLAVSFSLKYCGDWKVVPWRAFY